MLRLDPPNLPRNGPCPCGSGKKFKKCHLLIDRAEAVAAREKEAVEFLKSYQASRLVGAEETAEESDL